MSESASVAVVLLVAVLLGLRHATDPDHIAAMTTLVATGRERAARSAARLGAWWGIGHAITLVVFGIPVCSERYLPGAFSRAPRPPSPLIVFLGLRLIVAGVTAISISTPIRTRARAPPSGAYAARERSASGSSTESEEAPASVCSSSRDPVRDGCRGFAPPPRLVHGRVDDARDRGLRTHAHRASGGRGREH